MNNQVNKTRAEALANLTAETPLEQIKAAVNHYIEDYDRNNQNAGINSGEGIEEAENNVDAYLYAINKLTELAKVHRDMEIVLFANKIYNFHITPELEKLDKCDFGNLYVGSLHYQTDFGIPYWDGVSRIADGTHEETYFDEVTGTIFEMSWYDFRITLNDDFSLEEFDDCEIIRYYLAA